MTNYRPLYKIGDVLQDTFWYGSSITFVIRTFDEEDYVVDVYDDEKWVKNINLGQIYCDNFMKPITKLKKALL